MAHKNVKGVSKKTKNPILSWMYVFSGHGKKAFKKQVERPCASTFENLKLKKEKGDENKNTRVLALFMFYENRKSPVSKVLGVVVY